jgi:hypothetical protein
MGFTVVNCRLNLLGMVVDLVKTFSPYAIGWFGGWKVCFPESLPSKDQKLTGLDLKLLDSTFSAQAYLEAFLLILVISQLSRRISGSSGLMERSSSLCLMRSAASLWSPGE